ncbi:cell division protein FtsQ/DivIB [Rhodovulum sulfidophilum]|uniref:cell division protein FtsQ/DivIB n=1 Tax=Rhodovulum sulfidophilum TaxID=35806 RepID=UPI001923BDC7|nr:cell division protein FtsQ/DivIB [Rhodovulum sulfidophilum]MBL3561646.1 cell division protein FtsQ/DivIB [Rhodovulum sulfidophilum]
MRPVMPPYRDPAPSRWAYRAQRLWLTPMVRRAVLKGLPLVVLAAVPAIWLADAERRATLGDGLAEIRREIETRPEFMVKLLVIEGASDPIDREIRAIVPLNLPASSFDLDLEAMRQAVTALDAVKSAELRIRPGGVLEMKIAQREAALVWRSRDGLSLIDAGGRRVAALDSREDRADLPLIAGDGAGKAAPEAMALFAAAAPISDRVRGLVRMGERRWDVVLDRDQRILLPETGAVAALERVIALEDVSGMLARDIEAVDLRNPERPTLRLTEAAIEDFRKIRATQAGAVN